MPAADEHSLRPLPPPATTNISSSTANSARLHRRQHTGAATATLDKAASSSSSPSSSSSSAPSSSLSAVIASRLSRLGSRNAVSTSSNSANNSITNTKSNFIASTNAITSSSNSRNTNKITDLAGGERLLSAKMMLNTLNDDPQPLQLVSVYDCGEEVSDHSPGHRSVSRTSGFKLASVDSSNYCNRSSNSPTSSSSSSNGSYYHHQSQQHQTTSTDTASNSSNDNGDHDNNNNYHRNNNNNAVVAAGSQGARRHIEGEIEEVIDYEIDPESGGVPKCRRHSRLLTTTERRQSLPGVQMVVQTSACAVEEFVSGTELLPELLQHLSLDIKPLCDNNAQDEDFSYIDEVSDDSEPDRHLSNLAIDSDHHNGRTEAVAHHHHHHRPSSLLTLAKAPSSAVTATPSDVSIGSSVMSHRLLSNSSRDITRHLPTGSDSLLLASSALSSHRRLPLRASSSVSSNGGSSGYQSQASTPGSSSRYLASSTSSSTTSSPYTSTARRYSNDFALGSSGDSSSTRNSSRYQMPSTRRYSSNIFEQPFNRPSAFGSFGSAFGSSPEKSARYSSLKMKYHPDYATPSSVVTAPTSTSTSSSTTTPGSRHHRDSLSTASSAISGRRPYSNARSSSVLYARYQ